MPTHNRAFYNAAQEEARLLSPTTMWNRTKLVKRLWVPTANQPGYSFPQVYPTRVCEMGCGVLGRQTFS